MAAATGAIAVSVSNPTNRQLSNWPIEVTVKMPVGIPGDSITVSDSGKKIICQVENQYDDPATTDKELEIIWQADLKAGENKEFSISYGGGEAGAKKSVKTVDTDLRLTGEERTDIVTEEPVLIATGLQNAFLEIKLDGAVTWRFRGAAVRVLQVLPLAHNFFGNKRGDYVALERGPVRVRVKRQGRGGLLEETTYISIYANRPELHFVQRFSNASGKEVTTPGHPQRQYWCVLRPTPGGKMTTYEAEKGEDYVATATGGAGDEPQIMRFWGTDTAYVSRQLSTTQRWVDYYDTKSSPACSVGFICVAPRWIGLQHANEWFYPKRREYSPNTWQTKMSIRGLENQKLGPGGSIVFDWYIYPHPGDWKRTREFWRARSGVIPEIR